MKRLFTLLLAVLTGITLFPAVYAHTVSDCKSVVDGVFAWKESTEGVSSPEELLNGVLAENAGTGSPEWYAVAVCRYDSPVDAGVYADALYAYVKGARNLTVTDRQRIALAFSVTGTHKAYIEDTLKETVGKLGIMSCIYGLILLDSGSYSGADAADIVSQILALEIEDGGWALKGTSPDVDVTAMALTALAPYKTQTKVKAAVTRALAVLSAAQGEDGDFGSWGTKNAESTAQVLLALCSFGINPEKDGRFIKNGNSAVDGLLLYKTDGGGFAHTRDAGTSDTASVQVGYAFVAYWRFLSGRAALFDFTGSDKSSETVTETTKKAAQTTAKTASDTTVKETKTNGAASADTTTLSSEAQIGTFAETARSVSDTTAAGGAVSSPADSMASSEAVTQSVSGTDTDRSGIPLYKLILLCGIVLAASGTLVWLRLKRKLNKKNALLIALGAALLFVAAAFLNIQTPAEYYADASGTAGSGAAVTVEIRCDNAVGIVKSGAVPADGVILKEMTVDLKEGDTVYTVLTRAAKANKIPLDCEGGQAAGYYVKGIGQLYEFDGGALSGWVFLVNGAVSQASSSSYTLSAGDKILWTYTLDLGQDVASSSDALSEYTQPQ